MEDETKIEVTLTQIYIILSILLFLLLGYLFYTNLLEEDSVDVVTDKNQVEIELIISNLSSNETIVAINPCDSLEGDIKQNCILKTKMCTTDDCYYNQARLTRNESNCFNIKEVNLRVTCTSSISYDDIIQLAVVNNDITLCEKLEASEVIRGCKDNYNYVKAINTKDKNLCENIENIEVKNECLK